MKASILVNYYDYNSKDLYITNFSLENLKHDRYSIITVYIHVQKNTWLSLIQAKTEKNLNESTFTNNRRTK